MLGTVYWNSDALPTNATIDRVLYDIRRDDGDDGLIFDAVTEADILLDPAVESILSLDALTSPYSKLERKMQIMLQVMERAGTTVTPVSMQLSKPFKNRGVANVAAIFELSDGQTISIYFHNPDSQPTKLAPTDEMISWKWLLNKKDITIVVAPEHGEDLNVREVARRVMNLAEKNSAAFQRANARRAERMQNIADLKTESESLDKQLADTQATMAALESSLSDARIKLADSEAALANAQADADDGRKKLEADKAAFEEERARQQAEKDAAREAAEKAEAERNAAEEAAAKANESPNDAAPAPASDEKPKTSLSENEVPPSPVDETAVPMMDPQELSKPASNRVDIMPEPASGTEEGDPQWDADNAVLQQVIDGTHPQMDDPALSDVLTQIYGRWEGDEQKTAVVNQAIDAWANYALKVTENLV